MIISVVGLKLHLSSLVGLITFRGHLLYHCLWRTTKCRMGRKDWDVLSKQDKSCWTDDKLFMFRKLIY